MPRANCPAMQGYNAEYEQNNKDASLNTGDIFYLLEPARGLEPPTC